MEISVNLIRYRHCEWGASCKCHWEGKKNAEILSQHLFSTIYWDFCSYEPVMV